MGGMRAVVDLLKEIRNGIASLGGVTTGGGSTGSGITQAQVQNAVSAALAIQNARKHDEQFYELNAENLTETFAAGTFYGYSLEVQGGPCTIDKPGALGSLTLTPTTQFPLRIYENIDPLARDFDSAVIITAGTGAQVDLVRYFNV